MIFAFDTIASVESAEEVLRAEHFLSKGRSFNLDDFRLSEKLVLGILLFSFFFLLYSSDIFDFIPLRIYSFLCSSACAGTISLGSNRDADILVAGTGVEPVHCAIENNNGVVTLHPVNGNTFVDGVPINSPVRLVQGKGDLGLNTKNITLCGGVLKRHCGPARRKSLVTMLTKVNARIRLLTSDICSSRILIDITQR